MGRKKPKAKTRKIINQDRGGKGATGGEAGGRRHIVVVSDIHVGCQLGLCPPEGAEQAEGGRYIPSKFQNKLHALWDEFWNKHVPAITEGEDYDIVVNGEFIDGVHHNSVTQWSHNMTDQARAAVDLFKPIKKKCPGDLYVIRGSEAHSGQSGQFDEWIARELGAKPNSIGQSSRYDLWKTLRGGLVHFTHHIGTTSSSAYESTAVYKELVEAYVDAGRWGDRPPDVVVRSHRHRHMCIEVATGNGKALALVTPGWQGKTPFAHKVAGGRQSQPQFGGVVLSWSKTEKFIYARHRVWRLERDKPE
jgi:hypothetical protein